MPQQEDHALKRGGVQDEDPPRRRPSQVKEEEAKKRKSSQKSRSIEESPSKRPSQVRKEEEAKKIISSTIQEEVSPIKRPSQIKEEEARKRRSSRSTRSTTTSGKNKSIGKSSSSSSRRDSSKDDPIGSTAAESESKRRSSRSKDSKRHSSKPDADGTNDESKRKSSSKSKDSKRHSSKVDADGTNAESSKRKSSKSTKASSSSNKRSSTSDPEKRESRTHSSAKQSHSRADLSAKVHMSDDTSSSKRQSRAEKEPPSKSSSSSSKRHTSRESKYKELYLSALAEDGAKPSSNDKVEANVAEVVDLLTKFAKRKEEKQQPKEGEMKEPAKSVIPKSPAGRSVQLVLKKNDSRSKHQVAVEKDSRKKDDMPTWGSLLSNSMEDDPKNKDSKETPKVAIQQSPAKTESRPTPAFGILLGSSVKTEIREEGSKRNPPLVKQDLKKATNNQPPVLGIRPKSNQTPLGLGILEIFGGGSSKKDLKPTNTSGESQTSLEDGLKTENIKQTPQTPIFQILDCQPAPPPAKQELKKEASNQSLGLGFFEMFTGVSGRKDAEEPTSGKNPTSLEDGLKTDDIKETQKAPVLDIPSHAKQEPKKERSNPLPGFGILGMIMSGSSKKELQTTEAHGPTNLEFGLVKEDIRETTKTPVFLESPQVPPPAKEEPKQERSSQTPGIGFLEMFTGSFGKKDVEEPTGAENPTSLEDGLVNEDIKETTKAPILLDSPQVPSPFKQEPKQERSSQAPGIGFLEMSTGGSGKTNVEEPTRAENPTSLEDGLIKEDIEETTKAPVLLDSPQVPPPGKQEPKKERSSQTPGIGFLEMFTGSSGKKDVEEPTRAENLNSLEDGLVKEDSKEATMAPVFDRPKVPSKQDRKKERSNQTPGLGMLEIIMFGPGISSLTSNDCPTSLEEGMKKNDFQDNSKATFVLERPPEQRAAKPVVDRMHRRSKSKTPPILESLPEEPEQRSFHKSHRRSKSKSPPEHLVQKDMYKKHSKGTLKTVTLESPTTSSIETPLNTTLDSEESQEKIPAGENAKKKKKEQRKKPGYFKKLCCMAILLILIGGGLYTWYFWDEVLDLIGHGGGKGEAAVAMESPAPSVSQSPSMTPTLSMVPSDLPSIVPSSNPTLSFEPTILPSQQPSVSMVPSLSPSLSFAPSESFVPTGSLEPSSAPSVIPSAVPSLSQNPTWTKYSRSWDFKVRLQWQQSYFWQEENVERFWCLECVKCDEYGRGDGWEHGCRAYGSGDNRNCRNGDSIWIRDCRSRGNRFNVLQIEEKSFMLRLDNTNLCIERRNMHLMFRPCDENEMDQQFVPWFDFNKFELRPLEMEGWGEREADCVSQLHHPKSDEVVGMHNCRLSRIYETRHWEIYG